MTQPSNVVKTGKFIPFTIDGYPHETDDFTQKAADLLRLAGRDPANFDLGEIESKDRPHTRKYHDDDVVTIRKDARFVSIRQSAPVA